MAEPFLFNLCTLIQYRNLTDMLIGFTATLYELRSAIAVDKKRDLLIEVAKWGGDGLRTTCLKMPSG